MKPEHIAATLIGVSGLAPALVAGDLTFVESAADVGLTGGHATPAFEGMQAMSPGAAVGDFDRDGDQDVFVVGGSEGVDQLYINNGDGTFVDRADAWGVDAAGLRHNGAAVGDYDNDGDLDLYVTAVVVQGQGHIARNRLYRNNGDHTFTDVAQAAGVQRTPALLNDSFGAAFGDYDLDGDLDLFVAGWTGGNTLYRNNGDGTFTAQPDSVVAGDLFEIPRGFSPRFVDLTGDGRPDILLAADFFSSRVYVNNGDGTFTNETGAWDAGHDSNGMGSAVADFNNDGLFDWYVTSRIQLAGDDGSGNMLYVNQGGFFGEDSHAAGVNNGGWGWGADAVDFDHDGWVDLAATNGFPPPFEDDPTRIWLNTHDDACRFVDVTDAVGVSHTGQGRGLLTFDADLDGDRDLLIASNDEPLAFYRNDLAGPDAHAITLTFDTSGVPDLAPDGFGTRVELDALGMTQLRYLDGGCTYLSQSELSVHFGIGSAATADEIRVRWADGRATTLAGVPAGRYVITARSCPVDWTADGLLDLSDISGWITGFVARHPQADLTIDGLFDLADLQEFVVMFQGGCE
ncbi:MAG: CRTAC1 family protein [Phycisphaeraceae bacterium]|nr:MAG: CRTAC1 family protein [Phycisphaeraceae bacterium]